ncbi:MAG TPA: hypothetical protein VGF95_02125 [Solirubrobacteraceae bacterium]|jgi:predicted nucleotidyltransferase
MKRKHATALIEDLLRRIDAGGAYLDCIDEVWIFGSYARGALEPGDVDLDIEYTPDNDFRKFQIGRLASGSDWLGPLRRAVVARQRGFQVSYERRELYEEKGIELTLLWRRSDTLDIALERLHAINPDPDAGRSPRDAMLPAFQGIDRWVPLLVRQPLVKQVEAGTLTVEHIELRDAEPEDARAVSYVNRRWRAGSPFRRAGLAALAHVERHGGDPRAVHLHGRDVYNRDTPHFIGFKWRYYTRIPSCLADHGGEEWIDVVNPTQTRALHAMLIVPLDRDRLRHEEF